jgi:hypothetical protein
MTAAFGTRPKRRLNRVMDALNFEYPDYERLNKGAEGAKRKSVVSVLSRQAARMVKEDEKTLKKKKSSPEPKVVTSESRLEGGVNRANLKFTNLITTTSRVSVRNIKRV